MQTSKLDYGKLLSSITIGLILLSVLVIAFDIEPVIGAGDWWDSDWPFRKSLVINHSAVTADLTDFPVLIDLIDADLASKAQDDGDDIAFADHYGSKLNHEIELFNGTSGRLIAWVKIPNLSSTTDTVIYMYYGNAMVSSQENVEGVWDSNFMMVQHFNEKFEPHECRFWGMIANSLPEEVVLDHLIDMPYSLKNLGATNPDGWGLGYYNDTEPVVSRGEPPASEDPDFDSAAEEVASSGGRVAVGHVRKSGSPPYNIPNPHPFKRFKNDEWWLFAHHGVIDKVLLVELIGDEYLAANPPQHGGNIDEWNDSELYFLLLLKCIEESSWNVTAGVAKAISAICSEGSSDNLNFVLSDGYTLWTFRRGDAQHMLYYYYNSSSPQYSAVASRYPTSSQGDWQSLDNYNFVELTRDNPPYIIEDILGQVPADHYDSTSNHNDGAAYGDVVLCTDGKIDGADMFDGVNDYVSVADDSTLDGDGSWNEMTVEFWVKSTMDNQHATIILSKRDTSTYGSYQIGFDSAGDSQLFWGLYLDSGYGETSYADSPTLTTDQWYHVVGTFNAPTINLYINGVLEATSSQSGNIKATDGTPLRLGCRGTGSGTERHFKGGLDEVHVSNITRSNNWISTSFNNQHDPSSFYSIGSEETCELTMIRIDPTTTDAVIDENYTIYVEITHITDLYAWEFQLDYNSSILNLTSASIVPGGLNEPTYTFYNLTDEANGHLWWAVSTRHPTITGINYTKHAIFEISFNTISIGTSNLNLYDTTLSDNNGDPISHTVVNGSITVSEVGEIDLTITDINILVHGCSIYKDDTYVNGSAYYYPVEVTAHNNGTEAVGQFYVKLEVFWINGSLSEGSTEILVSGLAGGTSVVVNFTGFFHPMHTGHYRLTATVDSQDDITETNETNNVMVQSNIPVTVMGDVNGDGEVNILDGVIISLAWAATPSDPQWNICADVNHDGVIDILDGVRVGLHWGETW